MENSSKIIFFDNGCRVCRTGALLAGKSGLASNTELSGLQAMNDEVSCDLEKARYCNEIAVYDVNSKESRYGVNGIIWFLEDKMGKWINVFLLPPVYQIINFFYHIFSYNRKMIAPVYEKVENDCKPEFNWFYRMVYIALCVLISIAVTYFVGEELSKINFFNRWNGTWMVLFAGTGWILHSVLFLLSKEENKMEYLGHLSTLMLAGILIQVPFVLLAHYISNGIYLLLFILLMSDVLMTRIHIRRVKYLNLSKALTIGWWMILHITASTVVITYILCQQ